MKRIRSQAQDPPLDVLSREVVGLFHRLRAVAEELHADHGGLSAGHRGVLQSLHREGPHTVPALARMRPVSRQHIQLLVNDLLEQGLVRARPNPGHKRSPLLELTDKGRKRFEAMRQREHRALRQAGLPVSDKELLAAADVLRALREHLARLS